MNYKICGVCGDRALGFNLGALTCESCRSFFRRSALKFGELKCIFGQKCEININSRKCCKKCRFDKCLIIGMKRENIQASILKAQKIHSNVNKIIETTKDTSNGSITIKVDLTQSKELNENSGEKGIPLPYFIRGIIFELSYFEFNRIKQLFSAVSHIKEDPIVKPLSETKEFMAALKIIHKRCDIKCRRIVKMSTNITEFANFCEDDKIVLLKTGCPQINILISILNFNFEGEFWSIITDGNNATKLYLELFQNISQTLYESHRNFLFSLKEEWNQDFNILDFLAAIVLFSSNRQNLINKAIVGAEELNYKYLLGRYLQLKYKSKSVAQNKFSRLMNILEQLYALNRLHELSYLDTQPNTMKGAGALVQEIYDIELRNARFNSQ